MDITHAERAFARMCTDEKYAEAVSRGDIDLVVTETEGSALAHDAELLISETSGFSNQFRVEIDGISTGWFTAPNSHFHGSDFNAAFQQAARQPGD